MSKQTVLITGANRGIGLEFTRQFAVDGWEVIACCRRPDSADALVALRDEYPAIQIHALDVTHAGQAAELAAGLRERSIDILLSSAGIYGPRGAAFGKVEADGWRQVFEVNSIAPLILAQLFVDSVAASQRRLIAIVSSKMGSIGDNGSGGGYIYRSSKAAVNMVVKSLSIDLRERGITVLSLHPGWVRTDMGGPNAEITVEQSVSGMKRVLEATSLAESGRFVDYNGDPIPW